MEYMPALTSPIGSSAHSVLFRDIFYLHVAQELIDLLARQKGHVGVWRVPFVMDAKKLARKHATRCDGLFDAGKDCGEMHLRDKRQRELGADQIVHFVPIGKILERTLDDAQLLLRQLGEKYDCSG